MWHPVHIPGRFRVQWGKVHECVSETSCISGTIFLDLAVHSFAASSRKVILPPQMASENLSQETSWHIWTLAGISVQLPANTPGNVNTFFHFLSCLHYTLGGLDLGKHQYFDVMMWPMSTVRAYDCNFETSAHRGSKNQKKQDHKEKSNQWRALRRCPTYSLTEKWQLNVPPNEGFIFLPIVVCFLYQRMTSQSQLYKEGTGRTSLVTFLHPVTNRINPYQAPMISHLLCTWIHLKCDL